MAFTDIKFLTHEKITLGFVQNEKMLAQFLFNTNANEGAIKEIAHPCFQLGVAGEAYGFNPGLLTGYSRLPGEMSLTSANLEDEIISASYIHDRLGLRVTVKLGKVMGASVFRCTTEVENIGTEAQTLTHLSSISLEGIASDGLLTWNDPRKVRVHYCMQSWNGEGQWRNSTLEDLGLYRNSVHPNASSVQFFSTGSWSTGRYLPMIILEDMETGKVWYLQVETSTNWHIEIGWRGLWENETGSLFLQADGADEKFGGWSKTLQPGEKFVSVPVAVGCCEGSFGEAIRELTKYRRRVLKPEPAWEGEAPAFFNDYMNCLWANPSGEIEIALIDAAAKAGMEGFCIDAGWYVSLSNPNWSVLGDWEPGDDRFGKGGLQHILDYIRSKGMIPGLWLEMEMCSKCAKLFDKPDSWFLMRHGKRVGGGDRYPLNFANPEVREYTHSVIDRLVDMGVGFFKNDYNLCVGNGDDTKGSAADGLLLHMRGFYQFIDEVRARHPRLILENCGSGAMRQDYGALSHFHLQSVSDQEIYTLMPSVVMGGLAAVLPEQLGIWAYPYPMLFQNIKNTEILDSKEYKTAMQDGEQTIFNMVTGLCGNLYLSGRIDKADDLNSLLISEAVAVYKQERKFVHNAYPVWPNGFYRIGLKDAWACVGFCSEDKKRMLLAVWRMDSSDDYYCVPLDHMKETQIQIKQIYPLQKEFEVEKCYNSVSRVLTLKFPKRNQARLFEIKGVE